jgi:exopolyphosphatase/guanosine-5'-triphosphate,3'-diphosphate pyrophosphatase
MTVQHWQRIGIIDLGSNTSRLIVMAYIPGYAFRLIDEVSAAVRLAEGIGRDRRLRAGPIRRAVEALAMFSDLCKATGVETIMAVGTSAIREAANQHEFWAALRAATDLELQIISTDDEAYYGYLGAVNALPIRNGFTFDTGGGSTQVVEVRERQRVQSASAQAGVLRFSEKYIKSDPINRIDLRKLRSAAAEVFAPLDWLTAQPGDTLGGVGGTVRQLARIEQKQRNYPLDRVHGYQLRRESIEQMIEELARRDRRGRLQLPGLKSDRADVTLAGAVIIAALMDRVGLSELLVSGQGVREGLFYQHFLGGQPALCPDPRSFSVSNIARLTHYEAGHSEHVRRLALELFDRLQVLHGYGSWDRELLGHAAVLHDIGVSVGYYDHHKHGEYLIYNSTLLGFSHRETVIIASLVRNHRKGSNGAGAYAAILADGDERRIELLSGLLRVAEYLERGKSGRVTAIDVTIGERIVIDVSSDHGAELEIWEAGRRSSLLARCLGREIVIQAAAAPML